MKDSISSNQSTSGTYSSSLDDLTSLSSISSELTSLEPISSNQSTISSCNKSLLDEDKCNYMSSDLETLASPSLLINRELRQRLTMLSSDFDESDSKSDSLDTLSGNLSDMSDPSDEDNSSQSGMVKELYEHSIVHKTYDNLEEAEITNHFNNFEHLEGSDCEFSTKSTLKSNLSAEASDNSSISVADDDPAAIQQFKDMIKKQKIYLDSLQREFFRLQKMEQTLSKLHKKSKMQKEMLKKIEICDNCEGICNSACQLPSNSKKAPDVVNKPENLNRNNYPLTNYESSNENRIEKEQCVNYHSSVKVKSDATTQTKPSEYTRENNIVNFPTKKERIHQIHDKVDQIIHKLHEATTMDPDEPYHSIGVQTSNLVAPSQEINRKMNKSACKFASSTMDRSQKKAVYWTIPANEHKLDASSTKFNNFLSDYHQTEVLYPGSTNVSLQQAFRERCSHVLKNSESRVDRINIKSEMRKANTDCRFEQLDFMYKRDHDIIGNNGPDKVKVIKPRKIFTEKEMRKQTERLYSHLPEIKKLKEEKMKQQNGKTNRLVAKIFSQRLKSNAVHGKVTFPLTQKLTQI